MVTEVATWRFTVAEFQRMAEVGIFGEAERVELLDGEILQMNPVGSRHGATVARLNRLFARAFADRILLNVQSGLKLNLRSELQPDLALLRPRPDDYYNTLPTGPDTYLVVEVADTALAYDTGRKARAYARDGVSLLWVVVLAPTEAKRHVLVFENPTEDGYASKRRANRGDALTIPGLADVSIAITDFLP